MNVLAIAFVYNERAYIETAIKYYHSQGCNLYIIDNMSNDGTWEWLQENNIPSHRFDTQDAFQLEWLQEEMISTLHRLQPDWFVWFAPDLFHVFDRPIIQVIESLEYDGRFNQIHSPCYCFKNTGEEGHLPLWDVYDYAYLNIKVKLISRYTPEISIMSDVISMPAANAALTGAILEYGGCKPAEIMEAKLRRRQKAWELGTPKSHGCHYKDGKAMNWTYNRSDLLNGLENDEVQLSIQRLKNYLHD